MANGNLGGLLGAIANPNIPDIVGGIQQQEQANQQRLLFQQQQEELARQKRVRELSGQVLGQTQAAKFAGSGFDTLIREAPQQALALAKSMNVDLSETGRIKNILGLAAFTDNIARTVGPKEALDKINTERQKLNAFGIETPVLDKFANDFQQDPVAGVEGLAKFVEVNRQTGALPKRISTDPSAKEVAETAKIEAETDKIRADITALGQKGGKLTFKDRQSLNNNVTSLIKEPLKVKSATDRLIKIGKTKSPTDQLAAIYTYMKVLDPPSVVGEGEQRSARATGGPVDSLIGFVNQIKGEGALPPRIFNEMIATAKRVANVSLEGSKQELEGFLDPLSDDISANTKEKLLKRVPGIFEIKEAAPQTATDTQAGIDVPAAEPLQKIGRFEVLR